MQESFQGMMQSPPMDFTYHPPPPSQPPHHHSPPLATQPPTTSLPPVTAPLQTANPPSMPRIPSGIVNPLMRTADFTAPQHPYQNVYVPPIQPHDDGHYIYRVIGQTWS
jgi:hypothetical protein